MIENNWVESEGIKAWGIFSNYSNRKKSCTITKEDIEKESLQNSSAEELIFLSDMEELE